VYPRRDSAGFLDGVTKIFNARLFIIVRSKRNLDNFMSRHITRYFAGSDVFMRDRNTAGTPIRE
jgi:hypothetical protein